MTIVSRRENASRAVFAWQVVIEPSCPVFMACIMSMASAPRHSPITMRSGRMRKALITKSRCEISPAPSIFIGRVSRRTKCDCWSCNSAISSIVTTRSSSGTKRESVLSMVVFPEPEPPEITILRRACTQPERKSIIPCVKVSLRTKSSVDSSFLPKRRIDITGPISEIGGITAQTRDPSPSRASTIGEDSSIRRPMFDTMRSIINRTCAWSLNRTLVSCMMPLRSTYTESKPLTKISEMVASLNKASNGPSPKTSSRISSISFSRSLIVMGVPVSPTNRSTMLPIWSRIPSLRKPRN